MIEPLLELRGIKKRFGGVVALDGVDLTVREGSVQCVLGENGAGKSTLIKSVAGVHEPDEGEIRVAGRSVRIPDTATAEGLGIATIHQELSLIGHLTVADNILLGRELTRRGLVDRSGRDRAGGRRPRVAARGRRGAVLRRGQASGARALSKALRRADPR